jgi:hypothetical protein
MTESTFPFESADDAPESGGRDRKKLALVAGAGVLALAVLGYAVVLPAFSGGDDGGSTVAAPHKPRTGTTKTQAKAAPPKPVTQPQPYNDLTPNEDPFKALVSEDPPTNAGAVSGAGTVVPGATTGGRTGGTTTGATTGTTGTTSGSTGGATTGTTTTGSTASVGGQRVSLVHVYSKNGVWYAQTKVGDTTYSPAVGTVFAGSYKLLATSAHSATYLYGDEQFDLTEGQEVLK